jgi:hypothetical protein
MEILDNHITRMLDRKRNRPTIAIVLGNVVGRVEIVRPKHLAGPINASSLMRVNVDVVSGDDERCRLALDLGLVGVTLV